MNPLAFCRGKYHEEMINFQLHLHINLLKPWWNVFPQNHPLTTRNNKSNNDENKQEEVEEEEEELLLLLLLLLQLQLQLQLQLWKSRQPKPNNPTYDSKMTERSGKEQSCLPLRWFCGTSRWTSSLGEWWRYPTGGRACCSKIGCG